MNLKEHDLDQLSINTINTIQRLSADVVQKADSGHSIAIITPMLLPATAT